MSQISNEWDRAALRRRLATNLKRMRAARGLAQERLALDAGVDRTMLSKIERELTNPSLDTLLRIAQCLEVDVSELLAPTEPAMSTEELAACEPPPKI